MWGVDRGHPHLGLLPAWHMGDEGFARLPRGELPGPGQGHHIPVPLRLDQLHMGAGGRGRLGGDPKLLAPGLAPERLPHVPKQGMFALLGGLVCATDQREIDREARGSPRRMEDDDPKAEDVGMVRAEACLLGHRMLEPSLVLERTVAPRDSTPPSGGKHLRRRQSCW
jgi:hypothetical protein